MQSRNNPGQLRDTAMLARATFPSPDALPSAPVAPDPFAAASVDPLEALAPLNDTEVINDRVLRHLGGRIERIHDLVVTGLNERSPGRDRVGGPAPRNNR